MKRIYFYNCSNCVVNLTAREITKKIQSYEKIEFEFMEDILISISCEFGSFLSKSFLGQKKYNIAITSVYNTSYFENEMLILITHEKNLVMPNVYYERFFLSVDNKIMHEEICSVTNEKIIMEAYKTEKKLDLFVWKPFVQYFPIMLIFIFCGGIINSNFGWEIAVLYFVLLYPCFVTCIKIFGNKIDKLLSKILKRNTLDEDFYCKISDSGVKTFYNDVSRFNM